MKSAQFSSFRPRFEKLEDRAVPTVASLQAGGVLNIVGTAKNDFIDVRRSGTTLSVVGVPKTFSTSAVKRINILAGAGDDTIVMNRGATISQPAIIRAGAGNDTVNTGAGADSVFGEAGNDKILTFAGDDRITDTVGTNRLDGGTGVNNINGQLSSDRIRMNSVYAITMTGYSNGGGFQISARFAIVPRQYRTNTGNDLNDFDMVMLTNPLPTSFSPPVGTFTFATNRSLYSVFGDVNSAAALDFVDTTANFRTGQVVIRPDFAYYPTADFNLFTSGGGITSSIFKIHSGEIAMNFSAGGASVSGTVQLYGTLYYQFTNTPYVATFSGRRIA